MISRRHFLQALSSQAALAGLAGSSSLLSRTVFALAPGTQPAPANVLVYIFARGAMDGLSMLIPTKDANYYALRPNLSIPAQGSGAALTLDAQFGLHPAMTALMPLWKEGSLALVPQSGSPSSTRSHFDAQDEMEAGTFNGVLAHDGFLNRALQKSVVLTPSSVRGVALQTNMPYSLRGTFGALSMGGVEDFKIKEEKQRNVSSSISSLGFERMYAGAADKVVRGAGSEAFNAMQAVQQAVPFARDARKADVYPRSELATHLRDTAALIKAKVGLQVAVTEMGGFDTHVNQGSAQGQLADRFKQVSEAIAAFKQDLGPAYANVTIVFSTEFGRTMKQNGTNGTDHGHGSVMLLAGGPVKGGIHGKWLDLVPGNLFEERDVPVCTDFRTVMGEVLGKTLNPQNIQTVFPNFISPGSIGVMRG